jgi:hypothetical protein
VHAETANAALVKRQSGIGLTGLERIKRTPVVADGDHESLVVQLDPHFDAMLRVVVERVVDDIVDEFVEHDVPRSAHPHGNGVVVRKLLERLVQPFDLVETICEGELEDATQFFPLSPEYSHRDDRDPVRQHRLALKA